ncbi:hypothetical protein AV530_003351 [Patagioenas fasciata monilis]|uniref:Uncharacterized protein n=1 Tax=Patagioenas fasciata monilis TaxID=372326 RepID=A0A1V4K259_PATFA|nr:hypothetical protein AV530_003351 [Patagioenas fasciata monilis]
MSVGAWLCTRLLATGMDWEPRHLPPACDAKHKQDCSSVKTLRLKAENRLCRMTFRQHGAWTELLPARMLTGSRRARLHQGTSSFCE